MTKIYKKIKHHYRVVKQSLRRSIHGDKQRANVPYVRVFTLGLAIILVGSVILSLRPNNTRALATYTQSDWSGGVGTSSTNQYQSAVNLDTATAGKLTLGSSTASSWCNNATCNSSWTKRKQVTLTNNGTATTNQSVYFTVNKMESMKSDLADLRFTDASGSALTFYAADRPSTGTIAVWLRMPTITTGANTVYMYYGNSSASTESDPEGTVDFYDNFKSGSLDPTYWNLDITHNDPDNPDPRPGYSIANGEFTFESHDKAVYLTSAPPFFDFTKNWTVQYDFTMKSNCTDGNDGSLSMMTGYIYNRIRAVCVGSNQYKFSLKGDDPFSPSSETFNVGQKIILRRETSNTVGTQFYYSTDDGKTFQTFTGYTVGTNAYSTYGPPYNPLYFGWPWYGANESISNLSVVENYFDVSADVGIEYPYSASGTKAGLLNSTIINFDGVYTFNGVHLNGSGSGNASIKIRGSTQSNMSDASDFDACNSLTDGQDVSQSDCIEAGDTYLQYQLYVSANASNDYEFGSVALDYFFDNIAPTNASNIVIKKSPSGNTVTSGSWTNASTPYFSWTAGQDEQDGSGIQGYCLYLGTDSNPDLTTTSGQLKPYTYGIDYKGDDVRGACQYATYQTELDTSILSTMFTANLQNGETYYFIVKAIDGSGNIATDESAKASLKVDTQPPNLSTVFQVPGYTNTTEFKVSWPVIPGLTNFTDDDSGPVGMKYCVTNILIGMSGCTADDNNWYGEQHTTGRLDDTSDVHNYQNGSFTLSPADANRMDLNSGSTPGVNIVLIVAMDNAGNYQPVGQTLTIVTSLSSGAPSNLQVTPSSNTANAFSFTWGPPFISIGSNDYCWTVNDPIASDGSNCNWTGQGITQLASGPYATIQGTNTLYLMVKNGAGNFSNNEVASITFTASTTAPGPPQNTEISDVSTRATSTWKLALSWSAPAQVGAGVSSYKIYRSTSENGAYTQVGSTSPSNLSFIDSGLSQTDYYYHVKACDSANSCSVAGNVVTKRPTGRFTTPASLTADTNQPKVTDIGTKKATITWVTDRDSDSKVAYGTKPGVYNPAEIGSSTQTSSHSVTLTNLQPGTTYYYTARWTDQDGNTGASTERSFRTVDAPGVSEVSVRNVTINSAVINLTSRNASKVRLYYGQNESLGGAKEINTSTRSAVYDIALGGLSDGTKYFYQLSTIDSDGNEFKGDIRSFTTTSRPRITNLRFQPVEGSPSSTQKVSWTTNVPATSSISYGPIGQKPLEALTSDLKTEHELTISGLLDNTDYNLVARSVDASGNTAVSDTQTFKTALDTRPPKISDVSVETTIRGTGSEAKGQVIVSWKTDEKATSQVAFGQGQNGSLNSRTPRDDRLKTEHTIVLSDLPVSSVYRVQPVSQDKADNQTASEDQTVIIGRGTDNVFSIIFKALESIFRFNE